MTWTPGEAPSDTHLLGAGPMSGRLHAVSLFAGIGGFDLALSQAGIPTVAAVEIDPAARGVLADRLPDTVLFNDITEVTGDQLRAAGFDPRRGVVTAGWPCQGNSVAGRRGGMDDPRSGLWRHVVRLLAETRPAWFIGENVPGLHSVNGGRDIAVVRADLAQLGYWWAERVLDAQHFGVPQRRRRIFFVGHSGDGAAPVQVLLEPESRSRDSAAGRPARSGTAAVAALGASDGGADDNDATGGRLIAGPLQAAGASGRGHRIDAEGAANGHLIAATVSAKWAKGTGGPSGRGEGGNLLAYALRSTHAGVGQVHNTTYVTHALTCEGHDASEDGTGRGTPLVAFDWKTDGGPDARPNVSTDRTSGLRTEHQDAVATGQAVRRLTPTECERLQGFPDGWTATSGGAAQSDSARYRQLGNAVAVPVVAWIARRLAAVDRGDL